jgi:hypothetical protein
MPFQWQKKSLSVFLKISGDFATQPPIFKKSSFIFAGLLYSCRPRPVEAVEPPGRVFAFFVFGSATLRRKLR